MKSLSPLRRMEHIERNLKSHHNHPELVKLLWKAASARSTSDFPEISEHAYAWLMNEVKPEYWTDCYIKGRRYGHLTSNIVESLDSWLMPAREQPLLPIIETIHHGLMSWFEKRRNEAATWSENGFVPKVSNREMRLTVDYKGNYNVDDKSQTASVHASFRLDVRSQSTHPARSTSPRICG